MSKTRNVLSDDKQTIVGSSVGYSYGYVIFDSTPSHLEGKVLTILETAGLPQKQEEALKGLLRNAIWETIHESSVYITPERHQVIRDAYWAKKKEVGNEVPMSAI